MKNVKVGLTPVNWILSIVGILIFACFIILPPTFRALLKEEEIVPELPEEAIIETLSCTKSNIVTDNYNESVTYHFQYYKDVIQIYSRKSERTYNDPLMYESDKQLFGRYASAFSVLSGYKYLVDIVDENYSLTVNEQYDLAVFQNTVIIVPGDTVETNVMSEYSKSDSVSQIKSDLTSDGYTCE